MIDHLKKRVLLIDDDAFSRKMGIDLLRAIGFSQIDAASDALEAIKFMDYASKGFNEGEYVSGYFGADLGVRPYDLIICDYEMPKVSGIGLLKLIRMGKVSVPREVKFVLLTMHAKRFIVEEAAQLSASGYLIKPVTYGTFEKKIIEVIKTKVKLKTIEEYQSVVTYKSLSKR